MNKSRRLREWFGMAAATAILLLVGTGAFPRSQPTGVRRHAVQMNGIAFQPPVLELARGDTVVWINRDLVPHTASAEAKAGWSSEELAPGDSAIFLPQSAGEWRYTCKFHPTMRGKLIVR